MIRVLVVSPFSKDANSFHRCAGPWSYMTKLARKKDEAIEFSMAGDDLGLRGVAWDTVGQFDAVFLHRPCREDDLTILKVARLKGVPVWIDYDDWLFEVPSWNPNAGSYNNPGLQHVMATCIACADVISVTTSALYDKFRPLNKNTVIIPNCYREDLYPYRKTPGPRAAMFAWRGTNTHDADLYSVMHGMVGLPAKTRFYGGPFWLVLNQLRPGSFDVVGAQDPFLYMKQIYQDAPRVMIVPLVDCFFNRVKSNIAYMEALHAGALCVAPDLPEWQRPGVITYKAGDSRSFLHAAAEAYQLPDSTHERTVEESYAHMKDLYGAGRINELRVDTLRAMMTAEFQRNERDPFDQLVGIWALSQLKPGPKQPLTPGLTQGRMEACPPQENRETI